MMGKRRWNDRGMGGKCEALGSLHNDTVRNLVTAQVLSLQQAVLRQGYVAEARQMTRS